MAKPSFFKRLSSKTPAVDNYTGPRAPPSALKTLEASDARKLRSRKGKQHRARPAWDDSSDDDYDLHPSTSSPPPSSPSPLFHHPPSSPPPPPPDYLKPRPSTRAGTAKARHSVSFASHDDLYSPTAPVSPPTHRSDDPISRARKPRASALRSSSASASTSARQAPASQPPPPPARTPAPEPALALRPPPPVSRDSSSDSDRDVFFTPSGSPRSSLVEQEDDDDSSTQVASSSSMGAPVLIASSSSSVPPPQPVVMSPHDVSLHEVLAYEYDSRYPAPARPLSTSSTSSTPSAVPSSSNSTIAGSGSYTPSNSVKSWISSSGAPSTRATTPDNGRPTSYDSRSSSRSNSVRRQRKSDNAAAGSQYTNDDWAKDVRWLITNGPGSTPQSRQSSLDRHSTIAVTPPKHTRSRTMPDLSPEPSMSDRAAYRRAKAMSLHVNRNIGKRRMSAVWEEDESDDAVAPAPRRVATDPVQLSGLARARSLSTPQHRPSPLGEESRSHSRLSDVSGMTASSSSTTFTTPSRTVDLPVPLPVTDGGTVSHKFNQLVLPRAAYTPTSSRRYSLRFGSDSHVDMTRSGLASTTMSTISIIKNAAAAASTVSLASRSSKLRSFSSSLLHLPASESKLSISSTPSRLLTNLPRPLGFTSHTPPPSKVNSHQALVQVYAVGLDGLDDVIVAERAMRRDCYGFVPGRSFVGRVVEAGFEVTAAQKSDWVIGLLDVRKCGALAEFVVIDKRRMARCPKPSPSFTLEQLALLPLCGVPAHRAIRTFLYDDGARALVLQGHDGVGAIAIQELAALKVHVTVQIPFDSLPPDGNPNLRGIAAREENLRVAEQRVRLWGAAAVQVGDPVTAMEACADSAFDFVIDTVGGKRVWEAARRVLSVNGQFTTLVGDAGASDAASSSESVSEGHGSGSTTPHAVPSVQAHFRANLRSLRRAFVKTNVKSPLKGSKEHMKKHLGYAFVSAAADVDNGGDDVRDSLNALAELAEQGTLAPYVHSARCVPFEKAPELFADAGEATLLEGKTGTVRIVD